jgi:hypothetical protein
MRRLMVAVASLALLGAGLFIPADAKVATSPTDGLTGGTVKLVVGTDPVYGFPSWTTTISGQMAAGGRTYSGTASGTVDPVGGIGPEFVPLMSFAGSSSTGSIDATCGGEYVTIPGGVVPGAPAPDGQNPTGVLQSSCWVSIDGAPSVNVTVVFALAPTADPTTFQGVFAGLPDATALPAIPIVSFGHATASIADFGDGPTVGFGFDGQISTGLQTYRGSANGGTAYSSGTLVSIDVPPFALSGTSLFGGLNATCSGQFVSEAVLGGGGTNTPALSVLGCDGSANGGPAGHATLVSVYRETGQTIHAGSITDFDGVFAGA